MKPSWPFIVNIIALSLAIVYVLYNFVELLAHPSFEQGFYLLLGCVALLVLIGTARFFILEARRELLGKKPRRTKKAN